MTTAVDTPYRPEQQFDDLLRECAEVTAERDRLRNENTVLQGLLTEGRGLLENEVELLQLCVGDEGLTISVAEHRELLRSNRRWKVSAKILAIVLVIAGVWAWNRV